MGVLYGSVLKMAKMLIYYYSRTGNTEKMAKAVAEGASRVQGVEVELRRRVDPEELAAYDAVVIGTPTYNHRAPSTVDRLLEEVAVRKVELKDKVGAAFGSYGWSGEAPRLVLEVMKNKFEMNVVEQPLLIRYTPNEAGLKECSEFGESIAKKLMR